MPAKPNDFSKEKRVAAEQRLALKIEQDNLKLGLETIRYFLNLSSTLSEKALKHLSNYSHSSTYSDPIFVVLDIEGRLTNAREIGFAIFDTRDIKSASSREKGADFDFGGLIKSYNYIIRQNETKPLDRQIKYGKSQRIDVRWVPWLMDKILRTGSPDPEIMEERCVILLGHNVSSDLGRLQKTKVDLKSEECIGIDPIWNVPVLDTTLLSLSVIIISKESAGLYELVEWLDVPRKSCWVHVAGNDANLNLKVVLKMAIVSCQSEGMEREKILLNRVIEENRARWKEEIELVEDASVEQFREAELEALRREMEFEAREVAEIGKGTIEVEYSLSEMMEVACFSEDEFESWQL